MGRISLENIVISISAVLITNSKSPRPNTSPISAPKKLRIIISRKIYMPTSPSKNPSILIVAISRFRSSMLMLVKLYRTMNARPAAISTSTYTTAFSLSIEAEKLACRVSVLFNALTPSVSSSLELRSPAPSALLANTTLISAGSE